MLEWIAAIQPPLIGAVLLWSASTKLFTRRGRLGANDTALAKLVGKRYATAAHRGVGGIEAALAIALLAPPPWWAESAAVMVLSAGFLGYLGYGRIAAPASSCGCSSAHVPISWRGFARAGWLLAVGTLSLPAAAPWYEAVAGAPLAAAGLLLGLGAGFAALSPEFDGAWLYPLRRLRVRLTHPLAGDTSAVPLDHSVDQLQHSPVYRTVHSMLRTDVRESWEEANGWRMVVYGARYDARVVTAVFAVPMHRYSPEEVKVAFVDDETAQTLLRLDSAAGTGAEPGTVPATG